MLEALEDAGKPLFLRTKPGCPQKILCIWEYLCLKTTFFVCHVAQCVSDIFVKDCHIIPTFSTFSDYEQYVSGICILLYKEMT